jgi:polyhydroxyalkanoate synthase
MLNSFYQRFKKHTDLHKKRVNNIIAIQKNKITPQVAPTPFEVIGKSGRCRLLYFAPIVNENKKPIFITPSIINKYYILDLMDGVSFIQFLNQKNIPIYLLDWGDARTLDRNASLEDHIIHWLHWAVKKSCQHANVLKIDIFGQCIGGTFSTIYAALHHDKVNSLVLLTTPIDFHDDGLLSIWANKSKIDLALLGNMWGNIYRGFLKESFQYLKPLDRVRKYNNLYEHSWNEKFLDRYLAINHWVNDCVDFPGTTYVRYIQDFYQENLLYDGKLKLDNKLVDLKNITCPLMVIASDEDNIVSEKSAAAILDLVNSKRKEYKLIKGGHIGILLSSKARERFWEPVEHWLEEANDKFKSDNQ